MWYGLEKHVLFCMRWGKRTYASYLETWIIMEFPWGKQYVVVIMFTKSRNDLYSGTAENFNNSLRLMYYFKTWSCKDLRATLIVVELSNCPIVHGSKRSRQKFRKAHFIYRWARFETATYLDIIDSRMWSQKYPTLQRKHTNFEKKFIYFLP